MSDLSPSTELATVISWCVTVIRRDVITHRRRYLRWSSESQKGIPLAIECDNFKRMDIQDPNGNEGFLDVELELMLGTLSRVESYVLYHIFFLDKTEGWLAKQLKTTQQTINRIKKHGLHRLRMGWRV